VKEPRCASNLLDGLESACPGSDNATDAKFAKPMITDMFYFNG